MPLTINVTSEPPNEPVSLLEAKNHLRVDITEDDTLIESLITAARRHVEAVLGRALITQTLTLKLDRFPCRSGDTFYLPKSPVQSVTSITYVDTAGATVTLDAANYRVDSSSEPARVTPAYGLTWPATRELTNAVTITYVAGYGAAGSAVPADIRAAIKLLVGHLYTHRETELAGTMVTPLQFAVDSLLWPHRVLWSW